jgi:predicted nucleic acid binding AN1-type Zn finger protein
LNQIRKKLADTCKTISEVEDCKAWLPKPPQSINLVLIPDLSSRSKIEGQKENDIELLKYIWEKFKKNANLKGKSNDYLVVDLTDNEQLPIFSSYHLADSLIFDLSKEKDLNNKFFRKNNDKFNNNIEKIYASIEKTKGADFVHYFQSDAVKNIKKSDFFNEYRNVFIILTDGYLESETHSYTGNTQVQNLICKDWKITMSMDQAFAKSNVKPIVSYSPKEIDLSDVEILVLEVEERNFGKDCHYDILKKFWQDWFKAMNVKNANDDFFIRKVPAIQKTKNEIEKFLDKKYSYIDDKKGRGISEDIPRPLPIKTKDLSTNQKQTDIKVVPYTKVTPMPSDKHSIENLLLEYNEDTFNKIKSHFAEGMITHVKSTGEFLGVNIFKGRLQNGGLKGQKLSKLNIKNGKIEGIELE